MVQLKSKSYREIAQTLIRIFCKSKACYSMQLILIIDLDCYRYIIDWGDGTNIEGKVYVLGPFGAQQPYPQYPASYGVTVRFCSDPDVGNPCCDYMYQVIDIGA